MSAPRDPECAFMLATLFQMVGGAFLIDSTGKRWIGSNDLELTGDRLRVSVMVEGMLERLHPSDKDFVFDAFAECAVDPEDITATVAEPTRRAA